MIPFADLEELDKLKRSNDDIGRNTRETIRVLDRLRAGGRLLVGIAQIDNPYLDAGSNGLSYLVKRMKYQGIVGHITLAKSERSELAGLVADLL